MRVIAGTRRSLTLKTVPGMNTRPTTDRIKETLFNIISPDISGCRFLDAFSGSGGIGIEALSRGAMFCTFMENSRAAVRVIKENIAHTRLEGCSEIITGDALKNCERLGRNGTYDIVFLDPPYFKGLEAKFIETILKTNAVKADTIYIAEAAAETSFSWIEAAGLECIKEKNYKTNKHVFLKRK